MLPQTLLFTITTSIKASEGYEGWHAGRRLLLCPSRRKKRGGRRESTRNHLFFPDIRGGLVGIMEARKPDRQGRPASLQASSLPRFISYCHVAAWLGLLVSVCVFLCPVCVCSNVGLTREDGGGHIGQSKLHVYCVNVMAAITRFCQSRMFSAASVWLSDRLDTFQYFTQPPRLLYLPFCPSLFLLPTFKLVQLCSGFF